MRGFRLKGWQRIGIVMSVLWTLCVFMWFFQPGAEVNRAGISSVYLHCIAEPNANRRECKAKAERFRDQITSEFRRWPVFVIAPIFLMWGLLCGVVWLVRWITRGFQPSSN
jgi:hypothetical protein